MSYYFTSESVSQGHPDKVADQISDAIVDNFIARDSESHCAVETIVTTGQVVVAGEVKSEAYVDIPEVVRETINNIGYTKSEYRFDGNSCGILNAIHEQSQDIDRGVSRNTKEEQGAGDQGIMFGYATNETDNYMPATLDIAHKIVKELAEIRENEPHLMPYLRPDSKSQVTIEYSDDNVPIRISDIVVSTQHDEFADNDEHMLERIKYDVINKVIPRVKKKYSEKIQRLFNDEINYFVNPTGKFVIGGPHGDTGLTGRKIIVDTYGGWGAHGGGAFCVDGDTEFLSDDLQWHKISEYVSDQKVAQWTSDLGDVEFVEPSAYHVNPAEKMFRFLTEDTDQVLSLNHDMVVSTPDNYVRKVPVRDVIEHGLESDDRIPSVFTLNINFNANSTDELSEECINDIIMNNEYVSLYNTFKDCSWSELMNLGIVLNQKATFERKYPVVYETRIKRDADFAQIVMANYTDHAVTVEKQGDTYVVRCSDKFYIDPNSFNDIRQFTPADGLMYCFTVPSGMLVLRRNGKYFVTGNCGKDVSKVDRSAAYMARYLAKNAVAAGIADRMLIQFAYAIGVAEPISLFVNTYGTSHVDMSDGEIAKKIKSMFDLRPYAIEQKLKLRNPIYLETAAYGHMGQEPRTVTKKFISRYDTVEKTVELFTWEKLSDVDYFKSEFGL